tara:strand:+ start:353 stop:520 length:168 start_codon:yes stop_codon:yes gene_type:complete
MIILSILFGLTALGVIALGIWMATATIEVGDLDYDELERRRKLALILEALTREDV